MLEKILKKPQVSAITFSVVCALTLSGLYNNALWRVFFDNVNLIGAGDFAFSLSAFIALSCWIGLFLLLASVKYLTRPFAIIVFFAAALVSYFAAEYGVIINKSMLRNVLQTDVREATELLNLKLLGYLALYALLPALLMTRVRIHYQTFARELRLRLIAIAVTLALLLGSLGLFYKEFTFLFRQHTVMRSLINPVYPISALFKVLRERPRGKLQIRGIARDARREPPPAGTKPLLLLVVVGETARADHFSINGYGRQTTPLLAARKIFSFNPTTSCGTSTAESLPCMFSHLGRSAYSPVKARGFENLLDISRRTGVRTLWLDNNSGCKGVCSRVASKDTWNLKQADVCNPDECFDEILWQEMKRYLDTQARPADTLIVMHQKGSHGPAYYKRVPDRFRKYRPECNSVSLQECQRQEVINSYDNTIFYTDYFLSGLIDRLSGRAGDYRTGLIYMSDHGESLGELGIYLHGLPYALAPKAQTHVPHIEWYSADLLRQAGIDRSCLAAKQSGDYSHDNLFHTVLGLLHIETREYRAQLDMLASCRPP